MVGLKGNVMDSKYAQMQIYAFHSQTNEHMTCPTGMSEIMRGFSFLYFDSSSGSGHGVGLTNPGSCLAKFSVQPIMECTTDTCEVRGDDSSLWMPVGNIPDDLTASEYYPQDELIVGGAGTAADQSEEVKKFLSRCTVCESPSTVMAVHSFAKAIPSCPDKWEELWVGYSVIMGRDRGGGTGFDLDGHGSCLKYFTPQLSVRCVTSGSSGLPNCHFISQDQITAYIKASDWESPDGILGYFDPRLKTEAISRCAVCKRISNIQL